MAGREVSESYDVARAIRGAQSFLCATSPSPANVRLLQATLGFSRRSVTVRDDAGYERVGSVLQFLGMGVSPDDCSLALRGMQTLAVRLRALETSTLMVARWLADRPEIERVASSARFVQRWRTFEVTMRRGIAAAITLLCVAACSPRDASTRDSARDTGSAADSASVGTIPATTEKPDTVVPVTTMFTLASPAFQNGDTIPRIYTCEGANKSPPLDWTAPPPHAMSFALIVEDPDAPAGTFIHWVLYDLPASAASLPEEVPKAADLAQLGGAKQGRTGFGTVGYGGPCPPPGPAHHYHFRLFALSAKLGLAAGATRDQVVAAMRGHEIGRAELVGLYARSK
jgi:Raf kinase inhibitor-like YbhB/YbcL family protein